MLRSHDCQALKKRAKLDVETSLNSHSFMYKEFFGSEEIVWIWWRQQSFKFHFPWPIFGNCWLQCFLQVHTFFFVVSVPHISANLFPVPVFKTNSTVLESSPSRERKSAQTFFPEKNLSSWNCLCELEPLANSKGFRVSIFRSTVTSHCRSSEYCQERKNRFQLLCHGLSIQRVFETGQRQVMRKRQRQGKHKKAGAVADEQVQLDLCASLRSLWPHLKHR